MQKTVGIIGGMGPAATIDLMSRVVALSDIASEQDGVRMLVDSNPKVPDRNKAIAGTGPSPGPVLAKMALGLQHGGADFLVMACNTAHTFKDAITEAVSIPFISMIDETTAEVTRNCLPRTKVGVLAAGGCLDAGLYQTALSLAGFETLVLEDQSRVDLIRLLYTNKRGETSRAVRGEMRMLARELTIRGAGVILAGCTEVPLVLRATDLDVPLVDTTQILARAIVDIAAGRRDLPE
jgi:aspartate racemase